MKEIIIDIGANHGGFSLEVAQRNPQIYIYAIEPEPSLSTGLKKRTQELGLNNHVVCEFAVSTKNGFEDFYISSSSDKGTSSLLPFDNEKIKNDIYWSERADLQHSNKIQVQTTRLDAFLDTLDFDEIAFIKIDAQGLDLQVFATLGAHMPKVKAGMLEVVAVQSKALYQGENDDLRIALNALNGMGFEVYKIKPNDHASNEFNIFFRRSDIYQAEIEHAYHLKNLHFYDGKDFWHLPSNKLEDVESHESDVLQELNTLRNNIQIFDHKMIMAEKKIRDLEVEKQKLELIHNRLTNLFIFRFYRAIKKIFSR